MALLNFSDVLQNAGIDPKTVKLLAYAPFGLHQHEEAAGNICHWGMLPNSPGDIYLAHLEAP